MNCSESLVSLFQVLCFVNVFHEIYNLMYLYIHDVDENDSIESINRK